MGKKLGKEINVKFILPSAEFLYRPLSCQKANEKNKSEAILTLSVCQNMNLGSTRITTDLKTGRQNDTARYKEHIFEDLFDATMG